MGDGIEAAVRDLTGAVGELKGAVASEATTTRNQIAELFSRQRDIELHGCSRAQEHDRQVGENRDQIAAHLKEHKQPHATPSRSGNTVVAARERAAWIKPVAVGVGAVLSAIAALIFAFVHMVAPEAELHHDETPTSEYVSE